MRGPPRVLLPLVCLAVVVACAPAAWAQFIDVSVQKDVALYGDLDQRDVPNIGACACGPTAAVNSFWYLQQAYPGIYDNKLVPQQGADLNQDGVVDKYDDMAAVAQTLGTPRYMNTVCPGGTWNYNFVVGKHAYMENVARGLTVHRAMDGLGGYGGQNPPRPGWDQPVMPSWQFLYNNLVACEDVEILMIYGSEEGHYVTLTSFTWSDVNGDGAIQPDEGTIDYMDPIGNNPNQPRTAAHRIRPIQWNGVPGSPIMVDRYEDGRWWEITTAYAESPVPEPATLIVVGAGLLALVRRRRRKSA